MVPHPAYDDDLRTFVAACVLGSMILAAVIVLMFAAI